MPCADGQTDDDHQHDGEEPVQTPILHGQCADAADEGDHRADGQIDVGGDDDHQHTYRGDEHVGVLLEQRDHVVRIEQAAAGEDLEYDDHHNQREEDAVGASVTEQQLLEGLGFYLVVALLDGGGICS